MKASHIDKHLRKKIALAITRKLLKQSFFRKCFYYLQFVTTEVYEDIASSPLIVNCDHLIIKLFDISIFSCFLLYGKKTNFKLPNLSVINRFQSMHRFKQSLKFKRTQNY